MNKSGMTALYRQSRATQRIKQHGTSLVVQRKAASAAVAPTTQTLTAIVMTDGNAQDSAMAEGDVNAANSQPMTFVFQANADVRENVDRVIYHNYYYKLTSVYPTAEISNTVISITARAIKDGKAAA